MRTDTQKMNNYTSMLAAFAEQYDIALAENFNIDVPGEILDLEVEGMVVCLEAVPEQNGLLLYSIVGALPEDGGEGARGELLAANCFFQGTGGMTLGCAARDVVLQRLVDNPNTHPEDFGALLRRFIEMAAFWKERLARMPDAAGTEAPAVPRMGAIRG